MRATDHLLEKEKEKGRLRVPSGEPEDFELTMEQPAFQALNASESVFDRSARKTFGGINAGESVFDASALFKTEAKR